MTIEELKDIIDLHYGCQESAVSEFYHDLAAFIQECPDEHALCGDNPRQGAVKCLYCWSNSKRLQSLEARDRLRMLRAAQ